MAFISNAEPVCLQTHPLFVFERRSRIYCSGGTNSAPRKAQTTKSRRRTAVRELGVSLVSLSRFQLNDFPRIPRTVTILSIVLRDLRGFSQALITLASRKKDVIFSQSVHSILVSPRKKSASDSLPKRNVILKANAAYFQRIERRVNSVIPENDEGALIVAWMRRYKHRYFSCMNTMVVPCCE